MPYFTLRLLYSVTGQRMQSEPPGEYMTASRACMIEVMDVKGDKRRFSLTL